jgi:hypothetical protein
MMMPRRYNLPGVLCTLTFACVVLVSSLAAQGELPLPTALRTDEATATPGITATIEPVTVTPTVTPSQTPTASATWTPVITHTPTPCASPLGKPLQHSPAHKSEYWQIPVSIEFIWEDQCVAERYRLVVKNVKTREKIPIADLTRDGALCDGRTCRYTLPDLAAIKNTKYKWRVVAFRGSEKAKSDHRKFKLKPEPTVPTLIAPCDTGTTKIASPILTWSRAINAVSYQVILKQNGQHLLKTPDSMPAAETVCGEKECSLNLAALSIPVSLSPKLTYKWAIHAVNAAGVKAKSRKWEFIGNVPLTIVRQQAPIHGQPIDANEKPVVAWQSDSRLGEYRVTVRRGSVAGDLWEQTDWKGADEMCEANTETQATCPSALCLLTLDKPIAANTDYFWQVEGKTAAKEIVESDWRRFTGVP